jgi:ketosteroid isomerase-like protein
MGRRQGRGSLGEQARGKASGLNVDRRSGWVATFRDGKALSFEIYLDRRTPSKP